MSKFTELKNKMYKKASRGIAEEAKKRLEEAISLKESGNEAEGDKVVNNLIEWLEDLTLQMEKRLSPEEPSVVNRQDLPQKGEVIAVGNKIILSVLREDEKEKYLAVNAEYSSLKQMFKDEKFRESVWKDFLSDSAFVCSIYDKASKEYVGYCSVKNLVKGDWELAIELEPQACHMGYGTEALSLLMRELHGLTGKRFFRARVEIDNHASQGLMKKLGATPNGISAFLLYGEEIEKFQEENKDLITDEIREVAKDFCMDAEDILGYVLEYRFDMENIKGELQDGAE